MVLSHALPFVRKVKEKKAMLSRGDKGHEAISTAMLCAGGNMPCVFGAGVLMGFILSGMRNTFDNVMSVSAGAANAAFFLSGQTKPGPSVYYKQLVDKRFINPWRFWKFEDLDYLEKIFRDTLDVEALKKARQRFEIVVTTSNGKKLVVDAKATGVDVVSAIKASMAMPVLYNRPVEMLGHQCFDGVASDCLPIQTTMERFAPKHMLVVINHPLVDERERSHLIERVVTKLYLRKYPNALRRGFLERDKNYNESVSYLQSCRACNIAVVSPDYSIPSTTRDPEVLKEFAYHGAQKVWEVFGSGKLHRSDVLP